MGDVVAVQILKRRQCLLGLVLGEARKFWLEVPPVCRLTCGVWGCWYTGCCSASQYQWRLSSFHVHFACYGSLRQGYCCISPAVHMDAKHSTSGIPRKLRTSNAMHSNLLNHFRAIYRGGRTRRRVTMPLKNTEDFYGHSSVADKDRKWSITFTEL